VRDWYSGLGPGAQRLTLALALVCLASLPLYLVGFSRLATLTTPTPAQTDVAGDAAAPPEPAVPVATPTPSPAASAELPRPTSAAKPAQLAPPPPRAGPPGHEPGARPGEKKRRHRPDH